jgi:hypothetical protein
MTRSPIFLLNLVLLSIANLHCTSFEEKVEQSFKGCEKACKTLHDDHYQKCMTRPENIQVLVSSTSMKMVAEEMQGEEGFTKEEKEEAEAAISEANKISDRLKKTCTYEAKNSKEVSSCFSCCNATKTFALSSEESSTDMWQKCILGRQ